jgi:hypothetical protein
MPHYQTRVLTARDQALVDRLSRIPRYARVVEALTGGHKAKGKAAKQPPPAPAAPDTPAEHPKAASDHDSGPAAPSVPKPHPKAR